MKPKTNDNDVIKKLQNITKKKEKHLSVQADKLFKNTDGLVVIKKEQGRFSNAAGISDRLLCYKGIFIAIELKKVGGVLSDNQRNFLKKVTAAGGIGAVCYSVNEISAVLEFARVKSLTQSSDKISKPIFLDGKIL